MATFVIGLSGIGGIIKGKISLPGFSIFLLIHIWSIK
jgi:hypothetical protein